MIRKNCTIIVPAVMVDIMRNVSKMLDKLETDGMLLAPLSATGNFPATHFVSSGDIPQSYITAIGTSNRFEAAAKVAFLRDGVAFPYTAPQISAALAACKISYGTQTIVINTVPTVVFESALAFINRQGLQQIR